MKRIIFFPALFLLSLLFPTLIFAQNLNIDNYFAWCIVPFDNQNRTPEQRIEMLKNLGFNSYAYDWRAEHLPEMAKEINLAKEGGIKMNAVWMWLDQNDAPGNLSENNQKVMEVLEETGLQTQIWVSFPENYFDDLNQQQRLEKAVKMIGYVNSEARKLNCTVGLYNHGGWFGRPENLVKICEALPGQEVGIIFNFHHAHDMIDKFRELIKLMQPHLWAVNLNGMNPGGPKILPIGSGEKEAEMLAILKAAGYTGPFGILGHVEDADVELILKKNMEGLKEVLKKIKK
ncbi:MAG: sugar phosphate isomerase/epimerase [Mariniphaga sp.]|nr:sugar phosphate isomerase/epimerase [Mariniphaga sp.]